MNLISMININNERKSVEALDKTALKKNYGYSVYEVLEYGKNSHKQIGLGLQTELMKSFIR